MDSRPHLVDGREVEAKRAVPREDQNKDRNNVTVKKIFVGGIKGGISEDDMKAYFGVRGYVFQGRWRFWRRA